jgi:hypothetical protein
VVDWSLLFLRELKVLSSLSPFKGATAHDGLVAIFIAFAMLVGAGVARAEEAAPSPPSPAAPLALSSPAVATAPASSEAKASFKWAGDIRLRAQNEQQEGAATHLSEKIRLRLGVKVNVSPELSGEIRLATAKSSRSTNQTLGDEKEPGAPRRFIGLDLAYGEWRPLAELKVQAGRVPQGHVRPGGSQLLLDDDLALEGANAIVAIPLADSAWSLFGSAGSAVIRENYDSYYSEKLTDNALNWAQAGVKWATSSLRVSIGGGFFNFVGLQGKPFADLVSGGTALGNSERPSGVVKNAYLPREIFVETVWVNGPQEYSLFYERVINPETSDPNEAVWTGVAFVRKPFELSLAYAKIKSDAVPAVFTNSDFAAGQTDCEGTVASLRWSFTKNMSLRATQFLSRMKESTDRLSYNRTHFDLLASF